MPRADDVPSFKLSHTPTLCPGNPLGVKGCGEAGCAGSLACLINAVLDALAECGVTEINMPLTPERVWRAINAGAAREK